MKISKLPGAMLLLAALIFASCSDDDKIEIMQLSGTWTVVNDDPRIAVDGSIEYSFDGNENCSIYSYDVLSNRDTTMYRTYIISYNHALITLYDEDEHYTEQWDIAKLTSTNMVWEYRSSECGCVHNTKKFKKNNTK